METQRIRLSCQSCGKVLEYTPGEPPCEALRGWLTISHWKGAGTVPHYHFCSFSCLRQWVDAEVPRIPEAFLESFGENET